VVAGDAVPGADGLVFDRRCTPVFAHAQLTVGLVNGVRRSIDPPCDSAAPHTPCGPENGGLLPAVTWDQRLAEQAQQIADTCPIFSPPGPVNAPTHTNVFLDFSPEPVTPTELIEEAVANWEAKRIQYDPITGAGLRPGDRSQEVFSAMLWAEEIGLGVRADCPNDRSVVVMIMTPGHGIGPAYPPLLVD